MKGSMILAAISTFTMTFSGMHHLWGNSCILGDCVDACKCTAGSTPGNGPATPPCLNLQVLTPASYVDGCCRNLEDPVCEDGPCKFISGIIKVDNGCCGPNGILIIHSGAGPLSVNPGGTSPWFFWKSLSTACAGDKVDDQALIECYDVITKVTTVVLQSSYDMTCTDCPEHDGTGNE